MTSMWATWDDQLSQTSLALLRPAIEWVIPKGLILELHATLILQWLKVVLQIALGLLVVSCLISRRRISCSAHITLIAFICALHGQIDLVLTQTSIGLIFYGLAAFLLSTLHFIRRDRLEIPEPSSEPIRLPEALCFVALFIVGITLRFYALNRIFNYFEGEETPFAIAGTDLGSMSLADVGYDGPWSPFGYIYFFLVYISTKLFGTTLLSLRLGAAVPGMLMILLIYLFVRNTFSRTAAFAAAFMLTIDSKQVSWSRYEFPHGATALTAILITWLTYHSFKSDRLTPRILLMLCMGLCFHQYPSGQTAFLIPWFYFFYFIMFERGRNIRFYAARIPFLLCGSLLWYYGYSFAKYFAYGEWAPPAYLERFDSRVAWKSVNGRPFIEQALFLFGQYVNNLVDYFASLTQQVRISPPPQDHIPGYGNLPIRTIFLATPPLALVTLGILIRDPGWNQGAIIFSWIIAALIPCVLSNEAAPRRAATSFPALMCAAGVGYALLRNYTRSILGSLGRIFIPIVELCLVFALALTSISQWFSGQWMKYGDPGENRIIRQIQHFAKPGSIIVLDLQDPYMIGRLTFLMLDFLNAKENRPVLWFELNTQSATQFNALINDPQIVASLVGDSLLYRWSGLKYHALENSTRSSWDQLIYVTEHFPNSDQAEPARARLAQVRTNCADRKEVDYLNIPDFYHHFYITSCGIETKRDH